MYMEENDRIEEAMQNLQYYMNQLAELRKLRNKEMPTFGTDLKKFDEECVDLIDYINQSYQSNETSTLYLFRKNNTILYGKYYKGIKVQQHDIEMVSNEDLKKIYYILQNYFSNVCWEGSKHTMGIGCSLILGLGENIMIDINSYNMDDKNWFEKEIFEQNNSSKKR